MSEKRTVRSVAIALGITCIVLASGLVGALAYYVSLVNDKDNAISMLNSQISQLTLNVTNLQDLVEAYNSSINSLSSQVSILQEQVNDVLNVTATSASVDEIAYNPLAWVNKTVVVEGNLTGSLAYVPETMPPFNYVWVNSDGTFVYSFGVFWSKNENYNSTKVIVVGVVREGFRPMEGPFGAYFIQAEIVEPL